MRRANAVSIFLLLLLGPALATPSRLVDLVSTESVLRWVNAYRDKPDPAGVPDAVKALSKFGALKEPEQAGVYTGFLAGVLASNPDMAEEFVGKMLPLPAGDQWYIVRGIAYSGHPDWRNILRRTADRLPARRVMIDKFLNGTLPTLYQYEPEPYVSTWRAVSSKFTGKELPKAHVLEPTPELLDTYWGFYFATMQARPILRIIEILPLSKDTDNLDKMTLGNMAKYTLASNAARHPELLDILKSEREHRPKKEAKILTEVIEAADTVELAKLRREAMASIQDLQRKGPESRRSLSMWGQIGQGALAVGCLAAAATGHVELGLPCVIGGGASSAALSFWEKQQ
jgi:hypothetical protein